MISTAVKTTQQNTPTVEEMKRAAGKQAMMRNLTPAQLRAVAIAQQQVLRAQQARVAKNEREAARNRMWANSEIDETAVESTAKGSHREAAEVETFSLRKVQGSVLRSLRTRDHKTLREISQKAGVSLGYLSEVERGQKEASSELLASITDALDVKLSEMLVLVSERVREYEEAGLR
ncbi:helix-turn-helix domain-containing protein [Alloscardovia criceti]|uniref:helix-turn-helix domain-containing protein n=1 Tax=Alloscardovia criceti TaxID=356828 RepID=UPI000372F357|nr:helix-turn-helix transcriptional regulator [Alloscardovia criceti]